MKDKLGKGLVHCRTAMAMCQELGMDPLSDQVVMIWVRLAQELGHGEHEHMERVVSIVDARLCALRDALMEGKPEVERKRLLRWCLRAQLHLGSLYLDLERPEQAGKPLLWVTESIRGEKEMSGGGDQGDWLSDAEVARAFPEAGRYYDFIGKHTAAARSYI